MSCSSLSSTAAVYLAGYSVLHSLGLNKNTFRLLIQCTSDHHPGPIAMECSPKGFQFNCIALLWVGQYRPVVELTTTGTWPGGLTQTLHL